MEVIVSPAARDDIHAAYTYYAERNPDAAESFAASATPSMGWPSFP